MRFQSNHAQDLVSGLGVGHKLSLIPENHNTTSKYAVAVYKNSIKIGYLKEEHAIEYRRSFGLKSLEAVVERKQEYYIIVKVLDELALKETYEKELMERTKPVSIVDNTNNLKDTKMNVKNIKDSFFKEINTIAIDLQSGKLGVITPEGLAVYDSGIVNVNPLTELSVKIPAFAMRVKVEELKEGDILINGDKVSFYKGSAEKGGYTTINVDGSVDTVGAVNNLFFGRNTVMAVRNFFSGTGMNPLMLALALGDNKSGVDMKTFALMSMMGGPSDNNNMLMMALLLGNK